MRWQAAAWFCSTLALAQAPPDATAAPRIAALLTALQREPPRAHEVEAALHATRELSPTAMAPQLAALAARAAAVPEGALVEFVDQVATAAPYAGADARQQLDHLGDVVEQRTVATLGRKSATAAPLARALARLFGRARVDATATIEQLLAPIRDEWDYSRTAACEVLAARGPAASAAAPALRDYLARREHPVGHTKFAGAYHLMLDSPELAAARALVAVAPMPSPIAAHAVLARQGTNPDERQRAVVELAAAGGSADAAAAVDALLQATLDRDLRVLREVTTSLSALLPHDRRARAALEVLVNHSDPQVRARATAALRPSPSR